MLNTENMLECKKLTRTYNVFLQKKVFALQNINLEIKKGEVFALIGPNGSGKTTLFKILLGFITRFSGEFILNGSRNGEDLKIKEKIGFVAEQPYFYPDLNFAEAIKFCGSFYSNKEIVKKENIEKLILKVQMEEHSKKKISEYSKGMLQRLSIASAIINDPDLLIMDEPTSGLDPFVGDEIKNIILDLKKQGKTIIISSHLMSHTQDVCDSIGILYKGKLVKTGTLDDITRTSDQGIAIFETENKEIDFWQDSFKKAGIKLKSIDYLKNDLEESLKLIVDREKEK
ncbi:MAG: ABC transporter ATP-binding protein [Candidatus Aureabacteria bacterium]|nr:ABC transporter ATP-binding protein [Candidatus Auribacterota bacterium]